MKTFFRTYTEAQYETIAYYNPLLKAALPFEEVLTGDPAEMYERIDHFTSIKTIWQDARIASEVPSSDLVNAVLKDINAYGHSTVITVDKEIKFPQATEVFPNFNQGNFNPEYHELLNNMPAVCVNIQSRDVFIHVWDKMCKIVFGTKEYNCRHISINKRYTNIEYYVPVDLETKRVFVSSHCTGCQECKECNCVRPKSKGEIWFADESNGVLKKTPRAPYDFHHCNYCTVAIDYKRFIPILLVVYQKFLQAKSTAVTKVEDCKGTVAAHKARELQKDTIDIAVVASDDTDAFEHIIPLEAYHASVKHNYKGGKHASPRAHSVNGYWRRRSKYDSTPIFIKSFARGGSVKERDSINKSMSQKQKVYYLNSIE